jgi:hypothetical protein
MSRQEAKRRRDAQRRAKLRRESLEQKIEGSDSNGFARLPKDPPLRSLADAENRGKEKPHRKYKRKMASAWLLVFGMIISVSGLLFTVSGATPVFTDNWRPINFSWLLLSISGLFLIYHNWSLTTTRAKVAVCILGTIILSSFIAGSYSQIVIDGEVQLRGSVGDKSYRLAKQIMVDIVILDENRKLLDLPAEQARGVFDLYLQAAEQSGAIAARWNPATKEEAPLPGFISIFDKLNESADLLAQALLLYSEDLQQSDTARLQKIIATNARVNEILFGINGAVSDLSSTIAPLGIGLTVENGVVR